VPLISFCSKGSGYNVSNKSHKSNGELLTAEELADWSEQEIRDSIKAMKLRVCEAMELSTAYSLGKITADQANERFFRYEHRWREALPGTNAAPEAKDEAILAAIDEARGPYSSRRQIRERYEKRFSNRPGNAGYSR
jgi:hypothetical protein